MSMPEHSARASWNRERIASAIEAEIEALRQLRPHLESRLDRAGSLLVAQISCPPRSRPVRVRIGADGKARFLVASLTSPGSVYSVDASSFVCSCPDAHRRGRGCKHALAAFILKRVAREARPRKGCQVCINGWVYLGESAVSEETGEVVEAVNPVRCRRCATVEPPYLTDEQMQEWMDAVTWRFAKTYADRHQHEYCLRREQDPERFDAAARTIWTEGWDRLYLNRPWRTLKVGDYICWLWTRPEGPRMPFPEDTILVNRARANQLEQLHRGAS